MGRTGFSLLTFRPEYLPTFYRPEELIIYSWEVYLTDMILTICIYMYMSDMDMCIWERRTITFEFVGGLYSGAPRVHGGWQRQRTRMGSRHVWFPAAVTPTPGSEGCSEGR